jgi:DNA mismatch repair ATPase MutL
VFVDERHFCEPVRPTTVIVNQTFVSRTVDITRIQVANRMVMNAGPRTEAITRATGRQIRPVAVNQLRRKQETAVIARQPQLKALQQARASRKAVEGGVNPATERQTATPTEKAQRAESEHAQKQQREQATEQERRQKAQASEGRQEQTQGKGEVQKQEKAEKQQTNAEHKAAAKKKKNKPQQEEEGRPKEQPPAPAVGRTDSTN